ncbi:MAG: OmpA family protein [Acetobacteraceae bacterium]|jgi:outer membrane protein OmpA-like peptidoglycan-associated protein|nr:OmpA family protein [Acetobacteraceae bacterium]
MSLLRNAVFGAAAAVAVAAMPASAAVQCASVSPGDAGREEFVVFFGVGSAALDQAAQAVVQRAARQATATFKTEVCLIGRTSPTGSPQANQRLAQQRVQAVQNALVQRGVRRDTLGSFVPAAAFGAQVNRAENRADRSVTIIFVR